MKVDVRDLNSNKAIPPKIFEAFTDNNQIYIKVKKENSCLTVLWDDIVYQVNKLKNKMA